MAEFPIVDLSDDPSVGEELGRLRAQVAELEGMKGRALAELKDVKSLGELIKIRRILGESP
jgi:hypothetical protein